MNPECLDGYLGALYVFFLEPDAERIDPGKSSHRIVKAMIDHADHGYLIV